MDRTGTFNWVSMAFDPALLSVKLVPHDSDVPLMSQSFMPLAPVTWVWQLLPEIRVHVRHAQARKVLVDAVPTKAINTSSRQASVR